MGLGAALTRSIPGQKARGPMQAKKHGPSPSSAAMQALPPKPNAMLDTRPAWLGETPTPKIRKFRARDKQPASLEHFASQSRDLPPSSSGAASKRKLKVLDEPLPPTFKSKVLKLDNEHTWSATVTLTDGPPSVSHMTESADSCSRH